MKTEDQLRDKIKELEEIIELQTAVIKGISLLYTKDSLTPKTIWVLAINKPIFYN